MADQRRLYLLISDTLGSEGKAVESQKVSFRVIFGYVIWYKRAVDGCLQHQSAVSESAIGLAPSPGRLYTGNSTNHCAGVFSTPHVSLVMCQV